MLPGSVRSLFQSQYALVGAHQLLATCSSAERRRVRQDPDVQAVTPRVLRHLAATPDLGQQLLAPVLDAGERSALWGDAAAHWWGFGRARVGPVWVARPPSGPLANPLGVIHHVETIDWARDVTTHRQIPIVRPERLLLWFARQFVRASGQELGALRLARTLDHAWREGLVDGHFLHDLCARCGGKGNAGIVALREVLESRPPDYQPTESRLERRWEEAVGSVADQFRRQVVLGGDAAIGRFDQVHVSRPLVVEIHSEKFHTMPSDVARDEQRYAELVAAGFSVVIFWEYDIWHEPGLVRDSLRAILAVGDQRPTVHRPTPPPTSLLPVAS